MISGTGADQEYDFDLITIGAGSGGTRASRISSQKYGAKVACVELPFAFVASESEGGAGGTCVIRGCTPKKLLVYGSAFTEDFRDSKGFGWAVDKTPPFSWQQLLQKKTKEVERLTGIYKKLLRDTGVELIEGRGTVKDGHTVEVALATGGTRTITAKYILLALGGKPVRAPIPGKEHAITSDDALVLDDLPNASIVIVGAGYISAEFAGIFNGMGADVHLMYRKPLPLAGFDEECRQHVAETMQQRGIKLYPGCSPTEIEKCKDGKFTVHYTDKGRKDGTVEAGTVMFGTGRAPNTRNIGLEDAGVKLSHKGAIVVDEYSRTSVDSIFAIGDATDRMALTPVAIMEGMAFAATAFDDHPTKPVYQNVPTACFIQPPLSFVGLSEEQCKEQLSGEVDVFVSKFKPMKNVLSGREEKTLVKILVEVATDRVIGVHMVGPDAPEIIQGIAIALKCSATKKQFDSTVGIHPSAAEELVTMRNATRRIKCGVADSK